MYIAFLPHSIIRKIIFFAYDALSQVIEEINATGGITTYVYDKAGQQILVQSPEGLWSSYEYDGAGNITKEETGQNEVNYAYDTHSDLIQITYVDKTK